MMRKYGKIARGSFVLGFLGQGKVGVGVLDKRPYLRYF